MKLVHISLCGPVTDGLSYQDNLLPKYHKKIGFDVSMITSKYIWDKGKIGIDSRNVYKNEHEIKTIRLDNKFNTNIQSKFKRYHNLYENLNNERPDILFVHGVQFLDIKEVVRYVKENPQVKVYVDNHADFSNSATNWLSKNILHKILWRRMAKIVEPYTEKFYGVLPSRVDFLNEIYKIPKEKIELLVMGADDEKVENTISLKLGEEVRTRYGITDEEFLIVTGGKIDNAKRQTLLLMEAVKNISNMKIKLIVFGSVTPELKEDFMSLVDGKKIHYVGWIESEDSYQYFAGADLAVFPGGHSVLWEQVVAQGVPLVVKQGENMSHIDFDGNIKFLQENTYEEIYDLLLEIVSDKRLYKKMKNASKKNRKHFMYSNIARKSLELDVEYHV